MKKIVAIMLALALVFAMSTVAFAAIEENGDSEDAEVKVVIDSSALDDKFGEDEDPNDVDPEDATYKVDIDASKAEFKYTFDSDYNTTTHQYDSGSWDKLSDVITVTNHSNTSINVTAAFKDNGGTLNNVTATLADGDDDFDLDSAVNTENGVSKNVTVSITNTVPSVYEDFTLDNITFTIAGLDASAD